jgi:uncharacterized protein with HEPN domain
MPRNPRIYAEDILEAIRRIKTYTEGMDLAAFAGSPITIDAVVRNLEVIGEAAGRIPEDVRAAYSGIEWRKIIALRNVLAHEYFGIHTKIVWDVVSGKLEPLEAACRKILESLEEEGKG